MLVARVRKDIKQEGRVIGRLIDCLGKEGKIVFFSGKQQPRIRELVVLEKTEDKGKFIVCSGWRYENCNVLVFSKEANFQQYYKLEMAASVDGWLRNNPSRKEQFYVEGVENILEWIFFALADYGHKYVFEFESRELAQKFVPSILTNEFFIEDGALWRRDFPWERGDESRLSGYSEWPVAPKKELWLDEYGRPAPGPGRAKNKLADNSEEVVRNFIETNWPKMEQLSCENDVETGLIGPYDSEHWLWVREKSVGGAASNWRMAYLFKGHSKDDAFAFIQSWGKHHELAVLTTMPWVP